MDCTHPVYKLDTLGIHAFQNHFNQIYLLTNAREGDYYLCHPKYIALI
nr:MAG TPA: hypothetical protein [Bacteriophage sp.]